jgi:nucleoid-associated protein YgaU
MKNVAFVMVDNFLISAYGENAPTEEEGRANLEFFKSLDLSKVKLLIFTRGGAPTAAQRKDFNDALRGVQLVTAVVTDTNLVRGVVTALSWFNPKISAFANSAVTDAFRYLEIPPSRYDHFIREAAKLQAEVAPRKATGKIT